MKASSLIAAEPHNRDTSHNHFRTRNGQAFIPSLYYRPAVAPEQSCSVDNQGPRAPRSPPLISNLTALDTRHFVFILLPSLPLILLGETA